MKQVILNIPEDKYSFIMQLIREFDYISIENTITPISEADQQLANFMMQYEKPVDLLDENDFFKDLDKGLS